MVEENKSKMFDPLNVAAIGAAFQRKLLEIAQANAQSTFQFANQLMGCRNPGDFVHATQEYTRRQAEAFQKQSQELTGLARSDGEADKL